MEQMGERTPYGQQVQTKCCKGSSSSGDTKRGLISDLLVIHLSIFASVVPVTEPGKLFML